MITDVEAVTEANTEFYEAFEAADLDRMTAVWDDADDVSCVHPGWDELRGRDRVRRSWAVIFANTPYIQFFLTDLDVTVVGDLAVVRCAENILTSVEDLPAAGEATVRATNVYRRRDGRWRLWLHHGSPVVRMSGDGG